MSNWRPFATRLFATEDADPGYILLARADLPTPQKMRFMAAWATYYNVGIAAKASQLSGLKFWDYLDAQYATAKRSSERRHFRGAAGLKALAQWREMFPKPEYMVQSMMGSTYFRVREHAKAVPQIGPYFVWKFADVQERVFRVPCDFTGSEKYSPKVPQEGAKLIDRYHNITHVYKLIVEHLNAHIGNNMLHQAPPWHDRPYNVQEAETVCCIFHQYESGGYWWNSRTAKAVRRLLSEPCSAADALLEGLLKKRMPQWSHASARDWADSILSQEPKK